MNRLSEWPSFAELGPRLRRAVRAALVTGSSALRAPAPAGEFSLTFLPEREMRELNRRYLGRDEPTDVLAFDLGGEGEMLGDVYVAPEQALRSAGALGIPPEQELLRLAVHGALHVLGHDHPEGEDRYDSAMFRLQEEVLRKMGELG